MRRQHEPHRGGAAGRALEPVPEDEGLRAAAAAQGRGGRVGRVIDSRERFSAAADLYHRYRPSYPDALVDWIERTAGLLPPARVADVGCGTGVSTRLIAARGFDVTGIDPNEAMLAHARAAGGARYRRGTATETGLGDRSVDLVTVAQAFHWFDVPAALAEFRRILAGPGWCAAFWNLRAAAPFMDDYDRLLRAQSSQYEVLLKPEPTRQAILRAEGVAEAREAEFANRQLLDREGLLGRAHSSSYVVHGVADPKAFDHALGELFERHQSAGTVEFPYRTIALCCRLR
ncbi:MAG: SAM-dependent methyltransferase [Acidobacteria bacterium]|nr:MAG: SAM-dependent methyltransferase [Acidobacteriota bacterium]